MHVQVLGLGAAGFAAARLLQAQGHPVLIQDEQISSELQRRQDQLQAQGVRVDLGQPFHIQVGVEQLVVSPGIPWDHPILKQARNQGIEVLGEAELAWRSLQHLPWVGITGTNGKTTTTALIAAMFKSAGLNAPACGNIGLPLCQVALETLIGQAQPDWIVAELSSYQLEAAPTLADTSDPSASSDPSAPVPDSTSSPSFSPNLKIALNPPAPIRIGVWTTFTPDHLERHSTLENYAAIKARLLNQATYQVINGDDPYLQQHRSRWPQALWTSCEYPDAPVRIQSDWIWVQDQKLAPLGDFSQRLPGQHNLQNLLMAVGVAHLAGLDPAAIAQTIAEFPGVPHRLETVYENDQIRWINDSKATNYDAAAVGLTAVPAPIILIAGGKPKRGDDSVWLQLIQAKVATVLLIGEAAPAFAARLEQINYTSYQMAQTLDIAVPLALKAARSLQMGSNPILQSDHSDSANSLHQQDPSVTPGSDHDSITVLFSPACASFDQYANFEQRGEHFRQCCQQLGC